MKKSIFSIIILIVISSCVSIGNETHTQIGFPPLHFIEDGEYAFYLDNRYEDTYYRGYLKLTTIENDIAIIVRNINARTGAEERLAFYVGDDENGSPTNIYGIQGQITTNESMQAIPDFLNFISLFLRTQNNYEEQSIIYDDWGGFTLVFSFNKALPFFRFSDIKLLNDDEIKYSLLYGGVLTNINTFLDTNPGK